MSTNYYFTPAPDSPLAIYGQIHIGKQSAGWMFSFRGYKFDGGNVRAEIVQGYGRSAGLYVHVNAPGLWITSYEDWRELFSAFPSSGTIKNEYGEVLTLDEFCGSVILGRDSLLKWGGKTLLCHAKEHPYEHNWVDADGNSFSNYEFS